MGGHKLSANIMYIAGHSKDAIRRLPWFYESFVLKVHTLLPFSTSLVMIFASYESFKAPMHDINSSFQYDILGQ
jgi:hypothetical protein